MAVTAAEIMTKAGRVLNDENAVRWTLPELLDWINEGVSAIVLAKPSASSQTAVLSLVAGTWQQIGSSHLSLLRPVRNITSEGPPRVGGRVIRVTEGATLDAQAPDWHSQTQKKEVRQVVFDPSDPRSFYVYPPNDGTGKVEAIVSDLPATIAATGDASALASYATAIGLDDIYEVPLLDWVLWRAMSKDDEGGSPAGAMAHYQAFALALGVKTKVDAAKNPNAGAAA